MSYTTRRERCPLGAVETWIFDLDNTLYPASCRLFDQVQLRMTEFICERLSVSPEEAAELRRTYFREHGTTLRGLMTRNDIDPHEFLAFVHDIDLAAVPPDPPLAPVPSHPAGPGARRCAQAARRPQDRPHQRVDAACPAPPRSSRAQRFVLRHHRHRCRRFRPQAGTPRLSALAAAACGDRADRADDRRHRPQP